MPSKVDRHRINCDRRAYPWGEKGIDVSATERIILVSNRGPVQYGREDGERTANRGAGGLVTALSGLSSQLQDGVWVCAAMSDEDVVVAQESPEGLCPPELGDDDLRVRLVALDPAAQDDFYTVIANPLLWFIQHNLYDLKAGPNITRRERDAFESGYAAVNRRFAEVVVEEVDAAGGDAVVMLHDYHFYLLPAEVRRKCPGVVLHHFIHIPWPGPDAWRVLPPPIRDALFRGLLGNDVVGFHTEGYARNFLLGCQELLHLPVDLSAMEVVIDGRVVRARWYPISIDPEAFEAMAESPRSSLRNGNSRRADATISSSGSTAPTRARTSSGASWPTTSCSRTIRSWPNGSRSSPCSNRAGRTSRNTPPTSSGSRPSWTRSTASTAPATGSRSSCT